MLRDVRASVVYFGLIFLLGMVLGPIRILVLEPRVGTVPAVLIELPVMLAASWFACGWVARRFAVPNDTASRLLMGGLSFQLLIGAELGLGVFVLGGTVVGYFESYMEAAPAIGLLGQLVFGAFPLLRRDHAIGPPRLV